MSFFDKISTAETYNNLPYIEPGDYLFRIDCVKHITSKMGKGDFLVAEFTVLESNTTAINLQEGGRCAIRCKLADVMGPKNAAEFLTAAVGSLRGKVSKLEAADEALCVGENSQLVGKTVRAQAFLRPKVRTPGENYTHVNWQSVF